MPTPLDDKDTFIDPEADYFDEEEHVKNCPVCQEAKREVNNVP